MERRRYAILVYDRQARGEVSKALKTAKFLSWGIWRKRKDKDVAYYEYRSRDALMGEGAERWSATPRYVGDATDEEMDLVLAALKKIAPTRSWAGPRVGDGPR